MSDDPSPELDGGDVQDSYAVSADGDPAPTDDQGGVAVDTTTDGGDPAPEEMSSGAADQSDGDPAPTDVQSSVGDSDTLAQADNDDGPPPTLGPYAEEAGASDDEGDPEPSD